MQSIRLHTHNSDDAPWKDLSVLVTGGTGSFGKAFVDTVLRECRPRRLVVFSRDELKQHEMRQLYPDSLGGSDSPMRYFIGDVRDVDRLRRAMNGIDLVVHAAAMKQVPTCEYNPIEAVMTNVIGAKNVIEAALDTGVKRVLAISTDKAVNPVNLYGATKLVAEKLFVQANAYSGAGPTQFSCVRYGNVMGSRGSVIPLFLKQRETGRVTVTDPRMTRFWLTLDQGVRFVIKCISMMQGGEIFVPKIPSMKVTSLAEAIAPGCEIGYLGIRPGEKLHEVLISEDEAREAVEMEDLFIVKPPRPWQFGNRWPDARALPDGYRYSSETNTEWLSSEQLLDLAGLSSNGNGVHCKSAAA